MSKPTLNSDRFLGAFHSIEKLLFKVAKKDKGTSFYRLVDTASQSNAAVRHHAQDLKEFADLRNAIVHGRTDSHVIAEPNDRAVAEIERIVESLKNPPKVIPLFQTEVLRLQLSDSVADAVKSMYDRSFSQIPVYDGEKFIGVLTSNTVARWLGSCTDADICILSETTIASVLEYTEDEDNHVFLGRGATLFEVQGRFQDYERRGKRLEAILVTDRGKPTEKLLGVVTIWDLPKIHRALEAG